MDRHVNEFRRWLLVRVLLVIPRELANHGVNGMGYTPARFDPVQHGTQSVDERVLVAVSLFIKLGSRANRMNGGSERPGGVGDVCAW
jgi:hypothetical protein